MVNVGKYTIHGRYGLYKGWKTTQCYRDHEKPLHILHIMIHGTGIFTYTFRIKK